MKINESKLRNLVREQIISEMNANRLESKVQFEEGEGVLHVTFGKNGWGLTDEFLQIHDMIHRLSQKYNVYLEKASIDALDDKYDFVFRYDNEHFDD